MLGLFAQYLAQHRKEVLAQHRRDCSNKSGFRKSSLLIYIICKQRKQGKPVVLQCNLNPCS